MTSSSPAHTSLSRTSLATSQSGRRVVSSRKEGICTRSVSSSSRSLDASKKRNMHARPSRASSTNGAPPCTELVRFASARARSSAISAPLAPSASARCSAIPNSRFSGAYPKLWKGSEGRESIARAQAVAPRVGLRPGVESSIGIAVISSSATHAACPPARATSMGRMPLDAVPGSALAASSSRAHSSAPCWHAK